MELSDLLSEESVLSCTSIGSKAELLEKLSQTAAELTGQDATTILAALAAREELGSTGIGNGIAIPHGKLPGLPAVMGVFMRLDTPIEFDAIDDQKVDLVIMLLAPVGAGADHLKALARVARLLRVESLVDQLRRTHDPKHLRRLLLAPPTANAA